MKVNLEALTLEIMVPFVLTTQLQMMKILIIWILWMGRCLISHQVRTKKK